MKLLHQLDRVKRMNRLIMCGCTGSPEEFATHLGISESHLYRYIDEFRAMGVPVCYCRIRRTYYYPKNMELQLSYSLKVSSEEGAKEIFGGTQVSASLFIYESGATLL